MIGVVATDYLTFSRRLVWIVGEVTIGEGYEGDGSGHRHQKQKENDVVALVVAVGFEPFRLLSPLYLGLSDCVLLGQLSECPFIHLLSRGEGSCDRPAWWASWP